MGSPEPVTAVDLARPSVPTGRTLMCTVPSAERSGLAMALRQNGNHGRQYDAPGGPE